MPLVVDADALNILATSPRKLQADTVLTPHPGEAARLLSIMTHEVQADRRAAAQALCERFGCVVVLKGAGTVVAAPGRIACIIEAGNPGLARSEDHKTELQILTRHKYADFRLKKTT